MSSRDLWAQHPAYRELLQEIMDIAGAKQGWIIMRWMNRLVGLVEAEI